MLGLKGLSSDRHLIFRQNTLRGGGGGYSHQFRIGVCNKGSKKHFLSSVFETVYLKPPSESLGLNFEKTVYLLNFNFPI